VSEDRREDQAFLGRTVRENLTATLLALLEVTPIGVLDLARQRTMAAELVQTYGVRLPSLEAPMVALSGGNQQKAILARWLAQRPAVCILDEPTKGIDVGAKADVHRLVAELAAKGMGVLLISSDMEELLALSNRILVMHKGHISGELQPSAFDPTVILRMASTGSAA
jgi:ABC-type sugar transport system ATPase subunit